MDSSSSSKGNGGPVVMTDVAHGSVVVREIFVEFHSSVWLWKALHTGMAIWLPMVNHKVVDKISWLNGMFPSDSITLSLGTGCSVLFLFSTEAM